MLDRDELLALATKIQNGLYPSKEQADADIEILTNIVVDSAAIDYQFQKNMDTYPLKR